MTQKQHSLYPQLPVTAIHLQKQVGELRLRKYLTHLFDIVMDILQKYEPLLYLEKMKPQPVNIPGCCCVFYKAQKFLDLGYDILI